MPRFAALSLFSVLVLLGVFFHQAIGETIVGAELGRGRLRSFKVTGLPDLTNPDAVALKGVRAERNGNEGSVDAASFRIKSPAFDATKELVTAFAYFTASGEVSEDDVRVGKINAALFQMLVRYWGIFIFRDVDSKPGFQFNLTDINEQAVCPSNPTKDCLFSYYDFKDADWEPMEIKKQEVPYEDTTFEVVTVNLKTSDDVFEITHRFVSRPAVVEGIKITPDVTKMDIRIRYYDNPKFNIPSGTDCSDCKVGLLAGTAGAATRAQVDFTSERKLAFKDGAVVGIFRWEGTATVNRTGIDPSPKDVLFDVVTDDDIKAVDLTQVPFPGNLVLGGWKLAVGVWSAFKWSTNLYFFSFDENTPSEIFWDPETGAEIDYDAMSASPVMSVPFVLISCILALLKIF